MRNTKTHTTVAVTRLKYDKAIGGACKLYSLLQRKCADYLEKNDEVESFEANVVVDELPIDGTFSTDFLVKFKNGTFAAYECALRKYLDKPKTMRLLSLSRVNWIKKGVRWVLVTEAISNETL